MQNTPIRTEKIEKQNNNSNNTRIIEYFAVCDRSILLCFVFIQLKA